MKREERLYLKNILKAMKSMEEFVIGMDFEKFRLDDKTSSAVIRKFEIIGEPTKNIPRGIRQKFPEIPWKEMAGFRDKLMHFYFGIKYEIVWDTIKDLIPQLRPLVSKVLKNQEGGK